MAKGKMKKGLKITLIILGILLVLIIAALLIAPKMIVKTIYKQNFGTRFTSSEPHCRDIAEFDGLEREKHVFTSNEGQKITGYVYTKGDTELTGLIVLAHGFGGGGHCSYMDVADYFAARAAASSIDRLAAVAARSSRLSSAIATSSSLVYGS